MIRDILQREHPTLRGTAKEVPLSDIGTDKINSIIADMVVTMDKQKDGVAIAAPQIDIPLRIFVVSGDLLKQADKEYKGPGGSLVFINPTLLKLSREKRELEEGCLSVRWLYGKVKRSTKATIRAYNEKGEKIERGASGLLAQIFQHETDHLNGTLFIDKADQIWEMSEEEIKDLQNK
ncbi:MAG: peptide deformylase [Patescibacteria group bacterium]